MPVGAYSKAVRFEDLSRYFHLPEKTVARELGICVTSLKKLCRAHGISRWPFRKLKSLERALRSSPSVASVSGSELLQEAQPTKPAGEGARVKRKPYMCGGKLVMLSDEERKIVDVTLGERYRDGSLSSCERPVTLHARDTTGAAAALSAAPEGAPQPVTIPPGFDLNKLLAAASLLSAGGDFSLTPAAVSQAMQAMQPATNGGGPQPVLFVPVLQQAAGGAAAAPPADVVVPSVPVGSAAASASPASSGGAAAEDAEDAEAEEDGASSDGSGAPRVVPFKKRFKGSG